MAHGYHLVSVSAEPPCSNACMFHATNTGINTYTCVSTEWFKQEGAHLSVAVENSRVDKLKPRAGQLLLLQKFSSLQISFQILMQTIRQATKGSYCLFSNGRPNTFCRLNSYSWTIWTERRRMSDLHKVVPTCKMHFNVHITFANEQSSSSRTWQHCHIVVLSLSLSLSLSLDVTSNHLPSRPKSAVAAL